MKLKNLVFAALVLLTFFAGTAVHAGQEQSSVAVVDVEGLGPTAPSHLLARHNQVSRLVERHFRSIAQSDNSPYLGKCVVTLRMLPKTNQTKPFYDIYCWSLVMWQGDNGFDVMGQGETPQQVLQVIQGFAQRHEVRLRQGMLLNRPPKELRTI